MKIFQAINIHVKSSSRNHEILFRCRSYCKDILCIRAFPPHFSVGRETITLPHISSLTMSTSTFLWLMHLHLTPREARINQWVAFGISWLHYTLENPGIPLTLLLLYIQYAINRISRTTIHVSQRVHEMSTYALSRIRIYAILCVGPCFCLYTQQERKREEDEEERVRETIILSVTVDCRLRDNVMLPHVESWEFSLTD